jgi:hypothetical protein
VLDQWPLEPPVLTPILATGDPSADCLYDSTFCRPLTAKTTSFTRNPGRPTRRDLMAPSVLYRLRHGRPLILRQATGQAVFDWFTKRSHNPILREAGLKRALRSLGSVPGRCPLLTLDVIL